MQGRNDGSAKPHEHAHLTLLRQQIERDPKRIDLRMNLLEHCFEMRRVQDFRQHAQQLHTMLPDPSSSPEWSKVVRWAALLSLREAPFHSGRKEEKMAVDVAAADSAEPRWRRFGDEKKYRPLFDLVASRYEELSANPGFLNELDLELARAIGRPTSLFHASRLSQYYGGAQIYVKREDLNSDYHNTLVCVLGQAIVAKKSGMRTLVTGNSRSHIGAITASVASYLGLGAIIYMSTEELQSQLSDVHRIWLVGGVIEEVRGEVGDPLAVRQPALDHCAKNPNECFLITGMDGAPHPYPIMSWDFNAVVGRECQRQMNALARRAPDVLVARGGNNRDAIAMFPPFLQLPKTRLACVEGPPALDAAGVPANPIAAGEGEGSGRREAMTSPPAIREHAWLKGTGRVEYHMATPDQAKDSIATFSALQGMIPSIQTAYVMAWACAEAAKLPAEKAVVILLAEPPGKDISEIVRILGLPAAQA